jgi:hypothetical protein
VLRVAGGDIRFHGGHTIRRTIEGNIHAYSAPRRRILAPVIDLLNAALKADNGQLFAAEVAKLSQAVNDAIAKVTVALPVTPPTAAAPGTPATEPVRHADGALADEVRRASGRTHCPAEGCRRAGRGGHVR